MGQIIISYPEVQSSYEVSRSGFQSHPGTNVTKKTVRQCSLRGL